MNCVFEDRYVILGNHRDAWVFGAIDPSGGTAIMMEIARVMGELVTSGKYLSITRSLISAFVVRSLSRVISILAKFQGSSKSSL